MKLRRKTPRAGAACRGSVLEALERRMLMSVVIATGGKTATFRELDDDLVTITVSKGSLQAGMFTTAALGNEETLQQLNLSGGGFDGANLTITVKRSGSGDGHAKIGYINSIGHDLGNVTINGDVAKIDAGDANTATPAIGNLSVFSMGRYGTDALQTPDIFSNIVGALGSLSVAGDLTGVYINVDGGGVGANGSIGAVKIGGSIIGGLAVNSGVIVASGNIAKVTIGGDLLGLNNLTGRIFALGAMGDVTIGGSIRGGVDQFSGEIQAGLIGNITIKGSIFGGPSSESGVIKGDTLKSLKIGGDLVGGNASAGTYSGTILAPHGIGAVNIAGNIIGTAIKSSGSILCSAGNIGSLVVGGSIIGGATTGTGTVMASGAIGSAKIGHDVNGGEITASTLPMVVVGGSLIGGHDDISQGEIYASVALGTVKITGDVRGGAQLFDGLVMGLNSIGSVTVGGSVYGGADGNTGVIYSNGPIKSIKIGGVLQGGTGVSSGLVYGGSLNSLFIGGSVIGANVSQTGEVLVTHDIGSIFIGGDLRSGDAIGDSVNNTGDVTGGSIGTITLGGSIIAGAAINGGVLSNSGGLFAQDFGNITINGSLIGNPLGMPALITATGHVSPAANPDNVLKSLTIKGRVELAKLYFGFNSAVVPVDADVQVGTITVGGDWIESSISAGIDPGVDGFLGTIDDKKITGGKDDAELSRIASITIGGLVLGTPTSISNTDHYAFEAENIGAFKYNGTTLSLHPAPHSDVHEFAGTGDVVLLEL